MSEGLRWAVHKPNGEQLWSQLRLNSTAFMHGLFRQGAFKGVSSGVTVTAANMSGAFTGQQFTVYRSLPTWAKVELSKYFEQDVFERAIFPHLKPTSRPISLRLPEYLIMRIQEHAHEIDVPYQTLMKRYIAQGFAREV